MPFTTQRRQEITKHSSMTSHQFSVTTKIERTIQLLSQFLKNSEKVEDIKAQVTN